MRHILDYVEKSFQNYNKVTMIANNSRASTSDNYFYLTWTTDDGLGWAYYFGRLGLHI